MPSRPRPPKLHAHVRCQGGRFGPLKRLGRLYSSCAAAHAASPERICPSGCLGLGDCAGRCKTGALAISPTGVAVADRGRCTGCGRCLDACPRQLVILLEERQRAIVSCRSTLPENEQDCPRACNGCGRCLTACHQGAIVVLDFFAVINQHRCISCGLCAEWCPRHCISFTSLGGHFSDANPLRIPFTNKVTSCP